MSKRDYYDVLGVDMACLLESQFNSKMSDNERDKKLAGWKNAVKRTLSNR